MVRAWLVNVSPSSSRRAKRSPSAVANCPNTWSASASNSGEATSCNASRSPPTLA